MADPPRSRSLTGSVRPAVILDARSRRVVGRGTGPVVRWAGGRGNPDGGARAEGFTRTLGYEGVHRSGHGTPAVADADARPPRFPGGAYNARRLHPAPGRVRPVRFFEETNARAARPPDRDRSPVQPQGVSPLRA